MLLEACRRILVIQAGALKDVAEMSGAMEQLQRSLPQAEMMVLCPPQASRIALSLPGISQVLVHRVISEMGLACDAHQVENLIEVLRSEQFDAALIFPGVRSPYPLGYVCYLAGIPIRVSYSCEFGGGVLSHWVKSNAQNSGANLMMLEEVGLRLAEVACSQKR